MLAFLHDLGMVEVAEGSYDGRTGEDVSREFITAVIRTTLVIPASIVVPEPKRNRWIDVPIVEWDGVTFLVAQLLVMDTDELAAPDKSRARIAEGEEWKIGIVRDETRRDLWDARKVGLEGLDVDRLVAAEAAIPETLGLSPPWICELASHATGGEAHDELLHLAANPALPSTIDLNELANLASRQLVHDYLHPLVRQTDSRNDQPFSLPWDSIHGAAVPVCLQNRRIPAVQTTGEYISDWRKSQ